MTKLQSLVFVFVAVVFYSRTIVASGSHQLLENRAAFYGGLSMIVDVEGAECPANTFSCTDGDSQGPCCPTHTFCHSLGLYCCPTSNDCTETVAASPTCADPSWTLYNDGLLGQVCCPSGYVPDKEGGCVPPNNSDVASTYVIETQANSARPTTNNPANTAIGTTTSVDTTAGNSNPTGTGSAATASATKKSFAHKKFATSSALACVIGFVHLLL